MISTILYPIFGGIIGYITNDIAIRMLFHPHTAKYILNYHVPFTPGIIPKEKGRIANAMGNAISENLMSREVLERTLLSDEILTKLSQSIDSFCMKQKNNSETLRSFISVYLSEEEIDELTFNIESDFERLLVEKLSSSNFGDSIASIAVRYAGDKITHGLSGMFGANKLLETISAIAEPLLSKEINKVIRDNASEIISNLVGQQRNELLDTPMNTLFNGHDEFVNQVKNAICSIYRIVILEHLPRILLTLNLSNIIENRINEMDMKEIEPIIFEVMDKELKAIVRFGAGLGALIGCINIFI